MYCLTFQPIIRVSSYNKSKYSCGLIGSYDQSEDRHVDDVIHTFSFVCMSVFVFLVTLADNRERNI